MPEIYEMFFGLAELFRFFPQENKEFNEELNRYEEQIQYDMEQNRARLYGYESEFA